MSDIEFGELFQNYCDPSLMETGGTHNQKGIDFQRHWSVSRMFELTESGTGEFLFLFEAVQDLAELDSEINPTAICIYQIKKKDRNEWTWSNLSNLHHPKAKRKKPLTSVKDSSLGKLYSNVIAFKNLKTSARFISNSGCELPLASGGTVAKSDASALSELTPEYVSLLSEALETLHPTGGKGKADLTKIFLQKVPLSVDDPTRHLIGIVNEYLTKVSPRHAGQAASLVDALISQVSGLGRSTVNCIDFAEMRKRHGYSSGQFKAALGELETIPDSISILDSWASQLSSEGMSFMDVTAIKVSAAAIFKNKVMGRTTSEQENLILACNDWLEANPVTSNLLSYFNKAYIDIHAAHPTFKKAELLATFSLQAIKKCVDQTLSN